MLIVSGLGGFAYGLKGGILLADDADGFLLYLNTDLTDV